LFTSLLKNCVESLKGILIFQKAVEAILNEKMILATSKSLQQSSNYANCEEGQEDQLLQVFSKGI